MTIPPDANIPDSKLSQYLLVPRPWDDKSKYLAQAGFELSNPQALLAAIRQQAAANPAVEAGENEYGAFFRVEGNLTGPNGIELPVVTIWLQWHTDGSMHFVTLKPLREIKP